MTDISGPNVTTFYFGHLLALSKKYCQQDKVDNADFEIPIIFAALGTEAFMNDLEELAGFFSRSDEHPRVKVLKDTLKVLERSNEQVRLKYQLSYFSLTGNHLDKSSLPYQDFNTLIDIRNALIHSKPLKYDLNNFKMHKFVEHLHHRQVIKVEEPISPQDWHYFVITQDVARWSYNTAIKMIKLIFDATPQSYLRSLLSAQIQSLEEIT